MVTENTPDAKIDKRPAFGAKKLNLPADSDDDFDYDSAQYYSGEDYNKPEFGLFTGYKSK